MLPLYLSIEGLYSYQQKQKIDFTNLTEAGLFGIFGSVGSGKSSVLEAISFVLYGKTERLGGDDKRSYNMMNLKSNSAVIDFEFLNFEGRKFRFVAQWKRKKKFDSISPFERNAYEWINDNWIPLESNDGAKITNLSYPNFRRTIIIPQGQFKEFLELKGKDRSEMMKEIFFLSQYDLGPKVSHLQAINNKKIEHILGALSSFENVSPEIIEAKHKQFIDLDKNLANQRTEYEKLEIEFKALQISKQNRLDLMTKKTNLAELELQKPHIDKIEFEINEYELVTTNFQQPIAHLNQVNTSKKNLLTKIELLKESKDALKNSLNQVEKSLEEILPAYENLDTSKLIIQDLQRLIQNKAFEQVKVEKLINIEKGKKFYDEQKTKEQAIINLINELELTIQEIKKSKINTSELLAIDSWYQKNAQINNQIIEKDKQITLINKQLDELKIFYSANNIQESTWSTEMETKFQSIATQESTLKILESDLRLKQELSKYVHNLHDGEPCPLCGAAEHPAPMQIDDLKHEFDTLEKNKIQLEKQRNYLESLKSELLLTASKISEKQGELAVAKEVKLSLEQESTAHHSLFTWTNFDINNPKEFEIKKVEFFKIEEQLIQKEKELQDSRLAHQKIIELLQKSEQKLNSYQNEIHVLDSNIKQNLLNIQATNPEEYSHKNSDQIESLLANKKSEINKIQQDYQDLSKNLIEYKTQYAQIKGAYTEAQDQYGQYNSKGQEVQKILNSLLVEFNFADIAQVQIVLNKNLDIKELRNKIKDFYIAYQSLEARINELYKIAENDNYSDEKFEEISAIIQVKKDELEILIESFGALKDDLERLTSELNKKQHLIAEQEKLDNRKENLKLLDNMFRGNGFVNYVSSIHLHRLCEIANQRFHRLTKNQLSLVINENNEFEVLDYLNNGYRRSAKTLSGGQSFQASLCLALALAENIQSLNKADKNFFFIDEGFGTQDSESINTVFDTLQYLHQENRVVGIISHVEELKEKMPRAITIFKDLEKGSQVVTS